MRYFIFFLYLFESCSFGTQSPTISPTINARQFAAIKSEYLKDTLQPDHPNIEGYFLKIEQDSSKMKYYLSVKIRYNSSVKPPIEIKEIANAKKLIPKEGKSGNSLYLEQIDFDTQNFDPTELEYYSSCPKNEAMFISRIELLFLTTGSDYVVLSGSQITTGTPIDPSPYLEHPDKSGHLILTYFTLKLEPFNSVDSTNYEAYGISIEDTIKETPIFIESSNLVFKMDDAKQQQDQEIPIVVLATPCPPGWRPDTP